MITEIIVSLITSVITWTILTFGKTVLIPFYETLVYKGVFVNGTWTQTSTYNEGNEGDITYTETLTLNQKANKLTGIYSVSNIIDGQNKLTSIYNIEGILENNFIVLTGKIADKRHIGHNSFLLKIIAGGQQLTGVCNIVNRYGDAPISYSNLIYNRQV